jgi:Tfp pilus assembly protein PilF
MAAGPVTAFNAASLREAALDAEKRAAPDEAHRLFDRAMAMAPADAALVNSAAGSALRTGAIDRAVDLYARATRLAPENVEFTINRAIALGRAGKPAAAVAVLRLNESLGAGIPRFWSVRGGLEREAGDLDAAASSFERCLALEPQHALSLHGRARIALERGEADAACRYEEALAAETRDPEIWLGRAMALEAAGDAAQAQQISMQLVRQLPAWLPAQTYLAELKFAASPDDRTFADHFSTALERAPGATADIAWAWCKALVGGDAFAEAARVSQQLRDSRPADRQLTLIAASTASTQGDLRRADVLFAELGEEDPSVWLALARHRLCKHEPDAAERHLSGLLRLHPDNIEAWALRSLAWRLLEDPREEWLHGQPGMIARLPLEMGACELDKVIATLDVLHDRSGGPLGQSVRGGSQTRGALFARLEPELRVLGDAAWQAVERYRSELPAADATHPLLRHRDAGMRISGSWSVRLAAQGRHTVHIHPKGLLSSALHLRVPPSEPAEPRGGWLELGGAPTEMGLGLPPLAAIEPKVGTLALFPSTLYHGVRTFTQGERMTVAFDVALRSG